MQSVALQSDNYNICGGSTVIDTNNTSGFFPNQTTGVVAVYTQHHTVTGKKEPAIAYSADGGYTFTGCSKKLILPSLAGNHELRDPKVIWHEPTQHWVMVVAKATSTTIHIYTSPNLIDWTAASTFSNKDLVSANHSLEYPSLIPIPRLNSTGAKVPNLPTVPGGTILDFGDYILVTSSRRGSPLNEGSVTRYFPGTFNGTHFEPLNEYTDRVIDFGPDNYGTQFFSGLPLGVPVVGIGLAANLLDHDTTSRATSSPTGYELGQTRTSIFTGPREAYLINGPGEGDLSLFTRPVALEELRGETIANFSIAGSSPSKSTSKTEPKAQQAHYQSQLSYLGSDRSLSSAPQIFFNASDAVLIEAHFEMQPPDDEMVEINVDFVFTSSTSGSKPNSQILCTIIFRTFTADVGCARILSLSHPFSHSTSIPRSPSNDNDDSRLNQMSATHVRPLLPFHNPAVRRWEVHAILDQSILEVYLNGGVRAGTMRVGSALGSESGVGEGEGAGEGGGAGEGKGAGPGIGMDEIHFQSSKIPTWAALNVSVQRLRLQTEKAE
jgi:beta-fructofuranosidase